MFRMNTNRAELNLVLNVAASLTDSNSIWRRKCIARRRTFEKEGRANENSCDRRRFVCARDPGDGARIGAASSRFDRKWKQALEYLGKTWPDVMLLDLTLPEMSGEEVFQEISTVLVKLLQLLFSRQPKKRRIARNTCLEFCFLQNLTPLKIWKTFFSRSRVKAPRKILFTSSKI